MTTPSSKQLKFIKSAGSFYFLSPAPSLGQEINYAIAFFPFEKVSKSLKLSESWDKRGIYLFLNDTMTAHSQSEFEPALQRFLNASPLKDARFLWIENPTAPLAKWRYSFLSVKSGVVSRFTAFDFRNYSLTVARGSSVVLNQDGDGFSILEAGDGTKGFHLTTGYGANQLSGAGSEIQIPLQGKAVGCLQFDLSIKRPNPFGGAAQANHIQESELKLLDIGMRLFFRDPQFPGTETDYYITSTRHPLFYEQDEAAVETLLTGKNNEIQQLYTKDLPLTALLDPLHPLVQERTYFSFVDQTIKIPSNYRTNMGYTVHLTPQSTNRLFFARRPSARHTADSEIISTNTNGENESAPGPYYLVPSGEFIITVPRYNAAVSSSDQANSNDNLLCGISGLEYIKIQAKSQVRLNFIPGQPAYVPAYSSLTALLRDLPNILESFSKRSLPSDTTDLDMKIEDQEEGMGISDVERGQILEIVRKSYFPPDYQFTQKQLVEYNGLEIVEDLINWLRIALQTATYNGATEGSALTSLGTTSWGYVHSNNGAIYYAQPDQAPLYAAETSSQHFLDYLEIPSVGLPSKLDVPQLQSLKEATGIESLAFPMLPYGNVDAHSLADMRQLEISLINNYRRNRIHNISAATNHITLLGNAGEANPIGTTPQGLIASFSQDYRTIQQLQLMKDTKDKSISFVNITHGSALKGALQSNQLFMVISDPTAVSANFSTSVLAQISNATTSLDIKDWLFELGTDHWKKKGTILIFKFHNKALLDLAENPDLWSLADDLNGDKAGASRNLIRLLKQAVEIGNSDDPKERRKYEVLARAATQPNWTGILAFNVDVPPNSLPDSLKALAAGIDPDMFYAQYVGVEVTPVTSIGSQLSPQQSSLFGLIDYSNPNIPLADPSGYNFHVPLLSVVFQNSEIANFAAEVLIIMDRLFDEAATLWNSPNGKNILRLQGVAEDHNGKVTYSFGFSGANHFLLSGKVMQEVEIVKAQFATDPLPDLNTNPLSVKGRFFFWGRIRFAYLPDFDVLSFGPPPGTVITPEPTPGQEQSEPDYLSMNSLQITISFDLDQSTNQITNKVFAFNPNQLSFDLKRSGWRQHSLYEKFPLKFTGLRVVKGYDLNLGSFDSANSIPNKGNNLVLVAKIGGSYHVRIFDGNGARVIDKGPDAFSADKALGEQLNEALNNQPFDVKTKGELIQKITSSLGFAITDASQTLEKSGYMPVKTPGKPAELGTSWYGLTYDLNLGSAGALAGSAGLVVSILAAWNPEEEGLYIGLKLPGSSGGKKEIVIQGLLKITFKSIQFVVYPLNQDEGPATLPIRAEREVGYLLKIKNVMLKFFVLSFPPSGQTEFILFGDPRDDVERQDKLLGWYAAYAR